MKLLFNQIQSPHQLYRHVTHVTLCCSIVWMQYPHICVMILSIVFQWPWQTVHGPGLERQLWQHHILEQTKTLSRMRCCCCHVIWEGVCWGVRWGFVWTWPWWLHHPLRAMEDDTGKVGRTQRQVQSASEHSSKRWPLEGEKAWFLDCVHNIHNYHQFATNKRPDKGLNQTVLRVEFEVHMFLISAHSCTLPALPSLPEPSALRSSQTNCSNPCI